MDNVTQVPQAPQGAPAQQLMSLDELYRLYGEATIQFKIAQSKVLQIENQIQQIYNQTAIPVQK